jgi:hypothetical protein
MLLCHEPYPQPLGALIVASPEKKMECSYDERNVCIRKSCLSLGTEVWSLKRPVLLSKRDGLILSAIIGLIYYFLIELQMGFTWWQWYYNETRFKNSLVHSSYSGGSWPVALACILTTGQRTWICNPWCRSRRGMPSWEANSRSATPETLNTLWNPKVDYVHKSPSQVSILSFECCFFSNHFNIICGMIDRDKPSGLGPGDSRTQI